VTGRQIKFVGTGEKTDALEPFFPDRLAGRILGMAMFSRSSKKAEQAVDEDEALQLAEKSARRVYVGRFPGPVAPDSQVGPARSAPGAAANMGPLRGMNKMRVEEKELIHMRRSSIR